MQSLCNLASDVVVREAHTRVQGLFRWLLSHRVYGSEGMERLVHHAHVERERGFEGRGKALHVIPYSIAEGHGGERHGHFVKRTSTLHGHGGLVVRPSDCSRSILIWRIHYGVVLA